MKEIAWLGFSDHATKTERPASAGKKNYGVKKNFCHDRNFWSIEPIKNRKRSNRKKKFELNVALISKKTKVVIDRLIPIFCSWKYHWHVAAAAAAAAAAAVVAYCVQPLSFSRARLCCGFELELTIVSLEVDSPEWSHRLAVKSSACCIDRWTTLVSSLHIFVPLN